MVLQKQLIQLPFQGLQTKVDPKVAPIGTFANLDNFIMSRYPELVKRDGLGFLGQSTVPDNINAQYNYLNEIGVITNNALYSYSSALDKYLLKGKTASPIITAKPIISNTYSQTVPDSAVTNNNVIGVIWEDSRGDIRTSIKDLLTDTFVRSDIVISETGVKPKVVAVDSRLVYVWVEPGTNALHLQLYNSLTDVFESEQIVATGLANCYTFDVINCAGAALIAAVLSVAVPNKVMAYYWNVQKNEVGGISNGYPVPSSLLFTNSGVLPPCISLCEDPNKGYIICTVYNDSKQIYSKAFETYLAPRTSEVLVGSTSDNGWGLATCVTEFNSTYIFASSFDGTSHNSFQGVVENNVTTQNVTTYGNFFLQMSIASKAFWYSGNAYVIVAYDGQLQQSYFGVRNDGACWGRMFYSLGGGSAVKANSQTSFSLNPEKPNTYIAALLKTTEIVSSANSYFSVPSVFTEQIYFTPFSIDNKVLGRYLNIAGGYLKQYDGSPTVFEQGFHLYPQQPEAVQSVSTGTIANGTYSYVVTWEWKDNQGQIQRSNTSVPQTIEVTGANNTVTVTVPSLPITNKEFRFANNRSPVIMAVYRTQSLGTVYYRVNQLPAQFSYNDSELQTVSFIDTYSDANISSNSLLYTTGGVFANLTLPSTNLMCVAKNRVIVAGTDSEPNQLYISKQKEEGIGIEFANELSVIVDSLGGDITAIAAMDDKILIFKEALLFYIAGEGPDPTGNNGSFTIPLLVSSDCGCIYPQSIVLTGEGVMFLSQKGVYLCDRQLNITYVGQSIDAITTNPQTKPPNFQITSATNLPNQNQVYFTTNQDKVLVYDTFFKNWYTHTLPFNPISSTILDSKWFVSSTSQVYQSIQGQSYDGDGITISSNIRTNWISAAQLEGFARIFAVIVVGDNASFSHTLVMKLYYDFETFPREILKITPSSLEGSPYGIDTPYGFGPQTDTGNPYGVDDVYGQTPFYGVSSLLTTGNLFGGGYDGTYQFIARPKVQKCSSLMIEIYDQFPDGENSQSFKFSGLSIIAGLKQGWNKNLPYTRRFVP